MIACWRRTAEPFHGKAAIVTGAEGDERGDGQAVATLLAREGAAMTLVDGDAIGVSLATARKS